ncbi:MAG: DNA-3-methyladenine glycosylase I [Desulfarculaceae bacterium]|nr:DNA-3-methyladenine glycosylase I [Desulfarculaceae bacterium]MCF8071750.1 DNA-3-methyladenine glycosylase I [Desulfarculaceae bacterium]MCF8101300.1 DNA-3-methyladenine glycosylase I [Desulfarculaceae bacterium]MCF8117259.1 DNA-3-methyladenine glycosylase I [Desulfarculaceae bacterium]
MPRCPWAGDDPLYQDYHDREWGVPLHHERRHFEMLILEGFQAGLSWFTILKKRENFRAAFDNFDPHKVAAYGADKIEALMKDAGIVRNRRKIEAAKANARAFLAIQEEFGSFDQYIWSFVEHEPVQHAFQSPGEVPAQDETSRRISKDLKKRGMNFVGPTIIYAHMQATGMVNDHLVSCPRHAELGGAAPKG